MRYRRKVNNNYYELIINYVLLTISIIDRNIKLFLISATSKLIIYKYYYLKIKIRRISRARCVSRHWYFYLADVIAHLRLNKVRAHKI